MKVLSEKKNLIGSLVECVRRVMPSSGDRWERAFFKIAEKTMWYRDELKSHWLVAESELSGKNEKKNKQTKQEQSKKKKAKKLGRVWNYTTMLICNIITTFDMLTFWMEASLFVKYHDHFRFDLFWSILCCTPSVLIEHAVLVAIGNLSTRRF